ncbi:MAG: DegT/DnrJ/EryC1/StrS family aminotransferase [Candidatus Eisenbacteria bacterium]|uniref:DegT/DnrJ/EryC1/StrS family aminotransferase n=1 Tax=Eiseniibacteriota bacterium TaxID=2212470 RepID=A0A956M4I4_UNCEI|nr:DegT/DnrJ/EryC1/StrS family aminotransferase [Candidatus Eisenbacteria bacterium]
MPADAPRVAARRGGDTPRRGRLRQGRPRSGGIPGILPRIQPVRRSERRRRLRGDRSEKERTRVTVNDPRIHEPLARDGGRPVRSSYLIFGAPDLQDPEIAEVVEVLRSGWIGTGPRVGRFEEQFRDYVGARHAVALNSCTAGLHLSLIALGAQSGDEVIVPTMTFAATANSVCHVGARPVLVDCEPDTLNLDPRAVEAALTPKTKIIVPVHFAGRAADMTALEAIARPRGIRILEDAAHGVETVHQGRKIGTIGDCTAFSFYVTKNVVTGEGGIVTTEDEEIASWIKIAGLHGMSKDAWKRYSDDGFKHYEVEFPGFKYNMMDLQAALGLHQLARVEENWQKRATLWQRYRDAFADLPVQLPAPVRHGDRHAYHLFILLLDLDRLKWTRDQVQHALHQENIGTGIHYRAVHLHPYYRRSLGVRPESFPHATAISERTLSLPFSTKLGESDVHDVFAAVHKVLRAARR